MRQINWGMIGCGNVTEVKSGPAFNNADGSRLVAVMRRNQEIDLPTPEHIQQPLIQTIVNELLGRDTCPSTGETAARTSRVLDQVIKEYRQNSRSNAHMPH